MDYVQNGSKTRSNSVHIRNKSILINISMSMNHMCNCLLIICAEGNGIGLMLLFASK